MFKIVIRRVMVVSLGIGFILAGLGPSAVLAAGCPAPDIGFGRYKWCGYWYSRFQDSGTFVRDAGIPGYVNTVSEFQGLINGDIGSGDPHRETGGKFIVLTMIGAPVPAPPQTPGTGKAMSGAQYNDWLSRLNSYSNISENGSQSFGVNGRIDWFSWEHLPCGSANTYYQPSFNDIAPYTMHTGNSSCGDSSYYDELIVIRDTAGTPIYMIRRACMNPIGVMVALPPTPPPSWNTKPIINPYVNGAAAAGGVAEVGDTLTFEYLETNEGGSVNPPEGCTIYGNNRNGYVATPGTPTESSSGGFVVTFPVTCPVPTAPSYTGGVATETFVVTAENKTICRTLVVQPANPANGKRSTEVCVPVANKPYVKAFGGDVMVGSGLESAVAPDTCTSNPDGVIMAWNQRSPSYAGAGAQYAVTALGAITDFVSGQVAGAGISSGSGITLANTSADPGNGIFGGTVGAVPCIPNFFAKAPPIVNLSGAVDLNTLASGVYKYTGILDIPSAVTIAAGKKIVIYIDHGDLVIRDNIKYDDATAWNVSSIPLLEIVVQGNLFVLPNVSRVDGVMIAQYHAWDSGIVRTCSNGGAPRTLNGGLYSACNTKLTFNGSLTANTIEFSRTKGTRYQGTQTETPASSNAAEVINFTPAAWIPQPPLDGLADGYDSITSLPPVL